MKKQWILAVLVLAGCSIPKRVAKLETRSVEETGRITAVQKTTDEQKAFNDNVERYSLDLGRRVRDMEARVAALEVPKVSKKKK